MHHTSAPNRRTRALILILAALLLLSLGGNVYFALTAPRINAISPDALYTMEAGILRANLDFGPGEALEFTYDFDHPDYAALIETYDIDRIAGTGTELERALRLMDEFAPRLTHESDYDNSIEMAALPLLRYSLDQKQHGINCRSKAQILNEMCLALGIYARKVWLMPASCYDGECHVVNEIWDTQLQKWVMLDITNQVFWVDETGAPLSILEIRRKGAMQEFCTPIRTDERAVPLEQVREAHIADFLYLMKNLAYLEYSARYSVGEQGEIYLLFPKNLPSDYEKRVSLESCQRAPG